MAGLSRALAWTCAHEVLDGRPVEPRRQEVLEAAMWRAGRYGLEHTLISPGAGSPRPAVDAVADLLAFVRPGLEAHGDWAPVTDAVAQIVHGGNGAAQQRAAFARKHDPADVIEWAVASTASDRLAL